MANTTHPLGDLQNPKLIWAKGILFVVLGSLATLVLVTRLQATIDVALVLIAIWAFCRAYYFTFYVIEHYVDPTYRFDGLGSFLKYALRHDRGSGGE